MLASRPFREPPGPVLATAQNMAKKMPQEIAASQRAKPVTPPSQPSSALQVFPNPAPERDYRIQFVVPEFTCHCPLTGQPDFAHFTIDMVCDKLCVELKSLKMYFWSYRDQGAFHERVTNTVLEDIVKATRPRFVRVTARWYVRGGIFTNVVAEHCKKDWKAASPVLLASLDAATGSPGLA